MHNNSNLNKSRSILTWCIALLLGNDHTEFIFAEDVQAGIPQTALSHGIRLFAESCGYSVVEYYTQKIDTLYGGGFSFADNMAEIDAGFPVMIQLAGHSVVGVGYLEDTQTVYLHCSWGNYLTLMSWGGTYKNSTIRFKNYLFLAKSRRVVAFIPCSR